jgi:hypothetical protein
MIEQYREGAHKKVFRALDNPERARIEHTLIPNTATGVKMSKERPLSQEERTYIQSRYYIHKILAALFPKTIIPIDTLDDIAFTEEKRYIEGDAFQGQWKDIPLTTRRDLDTIQHMGFRVDLVGTGNLRYEHGTSGSLRYVDDVTVPAHSARTVMHSVKAHLRKEFPQGHRLHNEMQSAARMLERMLLFTHKR